MNRMSLDETKLEPPEDFSFPFEPYSIQKDFMTALFTALENRRLGIFESPTGTGKSLSLLCGALTWLQQAESHHLNELNTFVKSVDLSQEEAEANNCDNWISAQYELRKKKDFLAKLTREIAFIDATIEKRKKYLQKRKTVGVRKPMTYSIKDKKAQQESRVKEDAVSENGDANASEKESDAVIELMLNDDYAPEYFSDSDISDEEQENEPEFFPLKVIFASRTHSQISQFANELKRTSFASSVTAVSLGSRQNLCVNPDVVKLKNLSLMNEKCLELQKKRTKGTKTSKTKKIKTCNGCTFFNQAAIENLKETILSTPMDIEDLVSVAKECNACPYYASRKAAKEAQLILLPYNGVLHKGTREGIGLRLNNSVLLLDEAHNLIESISNMHCTSLNKAQTEDCANGLKVYLNRYKSRFSPQNLLQLKRIEFVMKSIRQHLNKSQGTNTIQKVFTIQEFKSEIGITNIDLYELQRFIKKSKLIFKLKGYLHLYQKTLETPVESDQKSADKTKGKVKSQSKLMVPASGQAILNFSEFLKCLLTPDQQARIIQDNESLKFLLLNTSDHFADLISSTRSIILAGGTMKPYVEVEEQLFQSARDRICHFSCDHVIPDENLMCLALTKGPSGAPLDFTFKQRNSPELMKELSRAVINITRIVPGGVVCFLPSYDYENAFFSYLKRTGELEALEQKKRLFRESKEASSDSTLAEYSRQIRNNVNGAVLFAVVGGKLSEGINFSDALGRCVIVVGLPFPNVTSVEIKEKVKFISDRFGKEHGQALLSNMCSKAVNQSIGRAIRHSGDFATIILMDQRYARPQQETLLPNWIRKRFQVCEKFGPVIGNVANFFRNKK